MAKVVGSLSGKIGRANQSRQQLARQAMSTALKDPHSISHELDAATTAALIQRLESRGRDTVFRSLFDGYFNECMSRDRILEVGAGTGVVSRALLSRGFEGHITGIDQSKAFSEVATELAAKDGFGDHQVEFGVGDATALEDELPRDTFDGVILHTLLSHVTNPGVHHPVI